MQYETQHVHAQYTRLLFYFDGSLAAAYFYSDGAVYGLINNIDTKAKCRYLKKLTYSIKGL
jgi:hypothetical protein